jgi:hypothetical protein
MNPSQALGWSEVFQRAGQAALANPVTWVVGVIVTMWALNIVKDFSASMLGLYLKFQNRRDGAEDYEGLERRDCKLDETAQAKIHAVHRISKDTNQRVIEIERHSERMVTACENITRMAEEGAKTYAATTIHLENLSMDVRDIKTDSTRIAAKVGA